MADLGAIEEDVPFDNGAADRLIAVCEGAASMVSGQLGSRAAWQATAAQEFRGHFADLFRDNQATGRADALELADRLREVATAARRLKEEAAKEQQRREVARQWKHEHDHRNLLEKGWDSLFGEDEPPVGPPAAPIHLPVSPPRTGHRQTPAPGSGGGGGGGTSSARPADLRTFASGSRAADQALRSRSGTLRGAYHDFQGSCRWGSLTADGVFTGFDQYLAANEEDVRWVTLVADAFARAGGEGQVSTVANSALLATLRAAGVDVTRDDITIDPPTAYGNPGTTGYADDPVNTATGNFLENEADLGFAGAAAALALTRTYNSFHTGVGGFGPGWSSVTEAGLVFTDDAARMRLPDGREVVFPRLGDGWDRAVGDNLWLSRAEDGGLRVTGNDGSWWDHAADGTLVAQGSGTGDRIRYVREEGRLVRLEHRRGRQIELVWRDGRVVRARASDGRVVDYGYDQAGRLVSATGPLGTRHYRWDEHDLVTAVVDADGVVEAENAYDPQRRVVRQRSPFGRLTRFAYLSGRVTVVSDEDGSRSNTWIHDDRGRLVGVVDALEQRQSTSYDPHGNAVLVTERDGAATVHEYDERGRRVRTVTPTGAEITYGWDELDRVTTVVTELGAVTEYGYEGTDRNPSTITDPEGGLTRLAWTDGLLTRVVDPVGVTVTFRYDEHGDLVATTDALGHTARLERDAAGRVVAATTPSGHRTTYAYDPDSGLLATRRDPDGATWRYEHTTAGRLAAVVDPTGARTTIEHGPHGGESRTVDPLGRAVTRHHDDLGNVASVELPDGSAWRFGHDPLSRLVRITDPAGAVWMHEYDETGTPTAMIDPTGVRRTVAVDRTSGTVQLDDGLASTAARFDPLGRVTAAEQADGSTAVATYDRCGRPVELLDAEGGLTLVRRDPAGRPIEVVSPTGATTRYEYDACGRLAAVVDPLGARTVREYDADGRLVRTVLPTGEVAWVEYDVCGRVTARYRPGAGAEFYRYDAAGRVVQSSDTWYGRRKFRYDAAGQLVEVVNGNGGVTRYDYDANGRAVAITDPVGGVTRREFDPMNRCLAETDPLGRTTRGGYDAAGRQTWQEDPSGRRVTWSYDASGRLATTAVDGRTVSAISRDLRSRTVTVTDHTRGEERPAVHELEWDRLGRLVRRSRDGRSVGWEYDAEGRRAALTAPDGARTTYTWDAAGRLTAVDHPLLGRATFEHDASGRVTAATAGDLIQTWEHRDGWVVAHTVGDSEGFTRTTVDRDGDGRVVRIDRDGVTTAFDYDQACQLIEARVGDSVTRWRYDAAGRLVAESADGAIRQHTYDAAGQLLTTSEPDGRELTYAYDPAGRRTRTADDRGWTRELDWSATGWLSGITDRGPQGVRRSTVHVDALAELADVDGSEVFWDTAAPYASSPVHADGVPVVSLGPVTGIGDVWTTPGWRTARSGADPWQAAGATALPGGLTLGGAGELVVAGLEWLGARVYDPTSRGFLSVDPLDPVPGVGWAGNPYSYAGNDPLHALDPTGLSPVTDAELRAYAAQHAGALHAAGQWLENNWEYVAGGAMVVAGGVLIATGVGGPAGMMLVSAGADTIIQKATTGEVNWGEVAISGAMGAWGAEGAAMRLGAKTALQRAVVGGMVSGGAGGALGSAYTYATGPGPHTATGLLQATGTGAGYGMVSGGVAGGAAHGLGAIGGRVLGHVEPAPVPPAPSPGKELVPYWPANRGALGEWNDDFLYAGTRIDRYGYPGGTFVAPEGTPYEMRALPPGSDSKPYHVYEVVKPIPVKSSTVAPAFGELGLGRQHELPMSVGKLVDHGILREIK